MNYKTIQKSRDTMQEAIDQLFEESVIRKYAGTMYEIRLDSGTTCIDRSDFDLDIAMGEG